MSLTITPARIVEESDSPLLAAADGWVRQPLGDVASIVNGCAFKSDKFSNHVGKPLIRIRDIFATTTAVGYLGDYEDRYLVSPGDLLVGMDGDFNSSRWKGPEALLNQRVCRVVPKPDHLDIDFLTALLPGYLKAIHEVTSSTTVTHLSSRDVALIPIPVPPMDEQRLIASAIRAVGDRRETASAHLNSARRGIERFRQAVLVAACAGRLTAHWREDRDVDVAEPSLLDTARDRRRRQLGVRFREPQPNEHGFESAAPEGWAHVPLGLLLEGIKYGTSKKCEYGGAGVPVLRIPNVSGGRVDLADLKFGVLPEHELHSLALTSSDLLMIRSNGSRQLVGRAVPVGRQAEGMAYAGYLVRLRADQHLLDPLYLMLALDTPSVRQQIEMPLRSTTGINNINTDEIRSLVVPLPSIEEQAEIVLRATHLLDLAASVSTRAARAEVQLDQSSDAVLAKAFRGELVPTT